MIQVQTVNDYPSIMDDLLFILKLYIIPYGSYFFGIYIRKRYMPEKDSPTLKVLMVIGIPVCLLIVTPILIAAKESLVTVNYAYLLTIGIIIEHGMVVHETAITRLSQKVKEVNNVGLTS